MDTLGVLTIGQNTVAFTLTATESFMDTFTIAGSTITVTDDEGETEDSQVTLTNNGTTLTLIDEDGDTFIFVRIGGNGNTNELTIANLTGTYDLNLESPGVMALEDDEDDVDLEVTMGLLTIGATTFTSTLTATGSVMETFTIAGNTITSTDDEGETENSQATLTNNGTTLTLVDEDGDTLIFDKR